MRITYRKRNGEVFQRTGSTYFTRRVGDVTSMGWEVLNIELYYKGKYYTRMELDKIRSKENRNERLIKTFLKVLKKAYIMLIYSLTLIILCRLLELTFL